MAAGLVLRLGRETAMFASTRAVAMSAGGTLIAGLVASLAFAEDAVVSRKCFETPYVKGKAELIITATNGNHRQLPRVLGEAKLNCVAQLQEDGACLVQVAPPPGRSIDTIAEQLRLNIFALKGGTAPKAAQDAIGKVIVNADLEDPDTNSIADVKPLPIAAATEQDPRLVDQVELSALDAESAWFGAQDSNVVTAIIDTGVKMDHEDLVGQFVGGITIGCLSKTCDGTPDLTSINKHHGTRVAGIIAARKFNPYGGAGVAWNTKFISVNYGPRVDQYRMACALQYAIEAGASIVNASWTGGYMAGQYSRYPWELFERYARLAERKGILIVLAAGNDGANLDAQRWYPLDFRLPNMLGVMAYNVSEDFVPVGNYGRNTIQIAAPDYAAVTTCIESTSCYIRTQAWGSSWSTAYVSGAAALLKSHYPDTDYDFLKWRIMANATPDERLSDMNQTGGRLNLVGTIFPVVSQYRDLSRTHESPINWKTGIRADMCSMVSIEARPIRAVIAGAYVTVVSATPNDGIERLLPSSFADIEEDRVQIRVQCLGASPGAESLPLKLSP